MAVVLAVADTQDEEERDMERRERDRGMRCLEELVEEMVECRGSGVAVVDVFDVSVVLILWIFSLLA